MHGKSYKYHQLNDYNWLYEHYVNKSLSTNNIRDIIGCKASNSIRQALMRHNIPIRNISQGLTVNSPKITINKDMIDGCLLGDSWLFRYNPNSDISMPYFIKKNKFLDHVEYNANILYPLIDINQFITTEYKGKSKYYIFRTPVYKELMSFYNRWYITGKRQPPDDIIITPELLKNWFMDDGSSYQRRKHSKTKQVVIVLSCEGFEPERIDMITSKLCEETNLNFLMTKCNSGCGFRISLSQKYTALFFDYIGSCPVESFQYKWK